MKIKTTNILTILLFLPVLLFSQISDRLTIELKDIQFQNTANGNDNIEWKSNNTTTETGSPKLPVYEVTYVLPVDAKVTDIKFTHKERKLLKQNVDIAPVEKQIPTNNEQSNDIIQQKSNVYDSDNPYPNILYEIKEDGFMQGYHIIILRIYPYQYIPKSKILYYYPNLEYTINYVIEPNSEIVKPLTQSEHRAELCKGYIKSLVKNPQDAERFGSNAQNITKNNKVSQKNGAPQRVKSLSILDEIKPDYIIITNNALKPTFQTLADWKIKKGIFTIIKTVEEIEQLYKGSDLPEKIRNYLIDSKNKWGDGLFILLGGDLSIVPARFVASDDYSDKSLYPTDKYYSTSNYWSYYNNIFQGSGTTLTINFTGRIPVSNVQELNTYSNKLISYEHASQISDLSYYKNILIADAFMLKCPDLDYRYYNGKSALKSYRDSYLSPLNLKTWLMFDDFNCTRTNKFYYDGPISGYCYDGKNPVPYPGGTCITGDDEFSKNNFISALNTGGTSGYGKFHIIYHMDHAGPTGMGTSGKDKGESIGITNFDGLDNGSYYQIMMSGSCHPANFAYDCMGKHYLINQNKGGVAFIGNTDNGWADEYTQFRDFCKALYKTGGFVDNGIYDIGSVFQYATSNTLSNWRLHLLGDPEMQVWTGVPADLTVTPNPATVTLGSQTVDITIAGLTSGTKAKICLWKGNEIYISQTVTGNGTYSIPFTANSIGTISVTVTAHNFKPNESTITVDSNSNPNPNLSVSTVDFGDGITQGLGSGNANGQNDAGETINLTLGIKNTGINTANGVTAILSSTSPLITITSSQGSFGNIGSGITATSNQFNYTIKKGAPGKDANGIARPECLANDPNPVSFTATIKDATNTIWTHNYNIDVFKDSIMQRNKTITWTSNGGDKVIGANEIVKFNVNLQNIGKATSKGLIAVLTSTSSTSIIQSCDNSQRTYSDITQYDSKANNIEFQFTTGPGYSSSSQLNFNLQVTNAYGKTWNLPFNLNEVRPSNVTNLKSSSDVSEIVLNWTSVSNVSGYNIYRCDANQTNDTEVGSYVKLNNIPVTAAYYSDINNLTSLTKYYYKVAAVSATGNEGSASPYMTWTSYPQKNLYPITLDASLGKTHTSVNVADVNYDEKKEIFIGTGGGYLVGLNANGDELYNIDNNQTTYSGFAKLDGVPWAIPAIGDMHKNGDYQIVEPTRTDLQSDNYVTCLSANDKISPYGKPDLMWNNFTSNKQYYRGVVMSNIDNSADGSLEVITCSDVQGCISVYSASGALLINIPCVNTYGAIAVADIDGDVNGDKEIIQASGTGIHVWHHDGAKYRVTTDVLYNLTMSGYRFVSSVVVCDINKDGHKDILTFAIQQNYPNQIKLFAIDYNGNALSGFDGTQNDLVYTNNDWYQELSVGDLNNDGYLEVVTFATNGIKVWDHTGKVWDQTGQPIFPISSTPITDINTASLPILADVDGDANADIVFASTTTNNIFAYKLDGMNALGFPLKLSSGYCYGLNISDIDNDGHNELIAGNDNKVLMWQTNGIPSRIEWGSERHDQYNTGEYQTICDPTFITSNAAWNSSQSQCGDLIVKSGTLTINNNSSITMDNSSMIIVMAGASLIVDSGSILNANVRALAGSNVTLKNNGSIKLRANAEFYTELTTVVDMQYGSIDK